MFIRFCCILFFFSNGLFNQVKAETDCDETLQKRSWKTTIYYQTSSDRKSGSENMRLKEALVKAKKNLKYVTGIKIVGHASKPGSEEANMFFSQKRAKNLEASFKSLGVGEKFFNTSWRGELDPLIDSETPEANAKNQRAEVIFSYAKSAFENCVNEKKQSMKKRTPIVVKEEVVKRPKEEKVASAFKAKFSFYGELSMFNNELSTEVGGVTGVDEVVSDVTVSGELGAYVQTAPRWSFGLFLGIRPLQHSVNLDIHVEEDHKDISYRAGAAAVFHMTPWWSHEVLVMLDQLAHLEGMPSQVRLGNSRWEFGVDSVARLEYRSHFRIFETQFFDGVLTPFFAVMTDGDLVFDTPLSAGGQFYLHTLKSKKLSFFGRYFQNLFSFRNSRKKQEILELGVRYQF